MNRNPIRHMLWNKIESRLIELTGSVDNSVIKWLRIDLEHRLCFKFYTLEEKIAAELRGVK